MIFSTLVAAFVFLPVIELAILFQVHDMIGLRWTIGVVILTGVIGAFLARLQGMMVLGQIQRDLAEGRMPAPRIMDGVMILIAAVLLVTPGMLTDSVGFLLLLPPVRTLIRGWMQVRIEKMIREGGTVTVWRV